jgi:hypothetical protein
VKNIKKKPGTGAAKGLKVPSDYKSRAADASPQAKDTAFQKAFGKAKDVSRKG